MPLMAFTISDLRDMIQLLEEHPDWRQTLRLVLLGEELLNMPLILRELVETQRRQLQEMEAIRATLAQMLEVQQRHEESLQRHEEWLQRLAAIGERHEESLQRHEEWLQRLAAIGERHEESLKRHEESLQRHEELLQRLAAIGERHEESLQRHEEWLQRLAAIGERHEESLKRHEESLQRHEELLQRLAEGQQRHEESLKRHEEWLQRLAEVQQRQEARMDEIAASQRRTEIELAELRQEMHQEIRAIRADLDRLANKLGLESEGLAEDTLQWVMEQKGWRLVEGPRSVNLNGEIDVVAVFENAEGQRVTVLMEVKLRLHRRAVDSWAHRVRSEGFVKRLKRLGLSPPFWVYLFGFRVEWTAGKLAEQRQIGLMTPRGEELPPVQLG
jgi:tetratricopeptide (TPR) repeat protein